MGGTILKIDIFNVYGLFQAASSRISVGIVRALMIVVLFHMQGLLVSRRFRYIRHISLKPLIGL